MVACAEEVGWARAGREQRKRDGGLKGGTEVLKQSEKKLLRASAFWVLVEYKLPLWDKVGIDECFLWSEHKTKKNWEGQQRDAGKKKICCDEEERKFHFLRSDRLEIGQVG